MTSDTDLQTAARQIAAVYAQEYTELLIQLREKRKMIDDLAEKFKIEIQLPDLDSDESVVDMGEPQIREGQFYGKPHTAAAAEYLSMCSDTPRTVDEILAALQKGGAVFTGKDPKTSLYTQLVRSTRKFVKLPTGTFGLLRWYPEEAEKRKRKSRRSKSSSSEKPASSESEIAVEGEGAENAPQTESK